MSTVLVAFATKNGSTQQVAEAIATALADDGAEAQCRSARTVRDAVHGFDLVVLGAPLYNGRWHLATTNIAVFGGVDPPGKPARRDLRDWAAITTWACSG